MIGIRNGGLDEIRETGPAHLAVGSTMMGCVGHLCGTTQKQRFACPGGVCAAWAMDSKSSVLRARAPAPCHGAGARACHASLSQV